MHEPGGYFIVDLPFLLAKAQCKGPYSLGLPRLESPFCGPLTSALVTP